MIAGFFNGEVSPGGIKTTKYTLALAFWAALVLKLRGNRDKAMHSDQLVKLFQPWPPPRPASEAGLVFGVEVAVLVTPWLELADAALANSEVGRPKRRQLRRHFRQLKRVVSRRHRRSA